MNDKSGKFQFINRIKPSVLIITLSFVCLLAGLIIIFIYCKTMKKVDSNVKLIASFTSRTEPGSDYCESGYDLNVSVDKIAMEELDGSIHEASDIIKKQYASYTPISSSSPGYLQISFASRDEACEYIGYKFMKHINWKQVEQQTRLHICGKENGDITTLTMDTGYTIHDIRMHLFSTIHTEQFQGVITTSTRTTEAVTFTEDTYTNKHKVDCFIMKGSVMESGYIGMDGYIVNQGVLYNLHVSYLKKDEDEAEQILYEWADEF